jgi:DNA polymerase-3 subunit beta
MKFTINTKELLKSLQLVGGLIKSPNQMPILDNVLFDIKDGILKIVADNLELRSTIEMPVQVDGSHSTCIPYALLVNTLKGFPNTPVDLVFTDKNLLVQSAIDGKVSGEYKIPVDKAEDFPKNKFELAGEKVSFNSLDFVEAIKRTSVYIDENSMNGMSNLLVWIGEADTKIVGGNSFLVYEYTLPVTGPDRKLLLSKTVVTYLAQSITVEEPLEVSFTENHIFFTLEGRQISAILGNIAFPDYKAIFDRIASTKTYHVDRDALFPALKRLCNVTDKISVGIDFKFTGDNLEMSFTSVTQKCDAIENIKVEYDGEPFYVGFNGNQVKGALVSLEGDIKLMMSEANRPALITADNTRCLTMPMKPTDIAVAK